MSLATWSEAEWLPVPQGFICLSVVCLKFLNPNFSTDVHTAPAGSRDHWFRDAFPASFCCVLRANQRARGQWIALLRSQLSFFEGLCMLLGCLDVAAGMLCTLSDGCCIGFRHIGVFKLKSHCNASLNLPGVPSQSYHCCSC
jgi:hypothetical protein